MVRTVHGQRGGRQRLRDYRGIERFRAFDVTNHHVVADTDKLTVQFNEGSEAEAFIKGQDSKMDLAVIAVPVTELSDSVLEAIEVAYAGLILTRWRWENLPLRSAIL